MTKKCPYCAEEIQQEAVKCKHCMEFLDESRRPPRADTGGEKGPIYFKTGFIILTFVTVPPFALPLIWLHPKLHIAWKLSLTVVIGLVCWAMYWVVTAFILQFQEATKMLEEMHF